jgi:hypothetical protein
MNSTTKTSLRELLRFSDLATNPLKNQKKSDSLLSQPTAKPKNEGRPSRRSQRSQFTEHSTHITLKMMRKSKPAQLPKTSQLSGLRFSLKRPNSRHTKSLKQVMFSRLQYPTTSSCPSLEKHFTSSKAIKMATKIGTTAMRTQLPK